MPTSIDPKRSYNMSRIRGKDTGIEMIVRRALHQMGYRYRLYAKDLPGKPDLVFRSRRAVIFVNGCFWHGHGCDLFQLPKNNSEFWAQKLRKNRDRDERNLREISKLGWRHLTVWECALRGPNRMNIDEVAGIVADWIEGAELNEVSGGMSPP